jgi:hypothetical protein
MRRFRFDAVALFDAPVLVVPPVPESRKGITMQIAPCSTVIPGYIHKQN